MSGLVFLAPPPFGKTKGSLLLLLMYFCSSLNKKLWFLNESESGRGEGSCRMGCGSVFALPLEQLMAGLGVGLCPASGPRPRKPIAEPSSLSASSLPVLTGGSEAHSGGRPLVLHP